LRAELVNGRAGLRETAAEVFAGAVVCGTQDRLGQALAPQVLGLRQCRPGRRGSCIISL